MHHNALLLAFSRPCKIAFYSNSHMQVAADIVLKLIETPASSLLLPHSTQEWLGVVRRLTPLPLSHQVTCPSYPPSHHASPPLLCALIPHVTDWQVSHVAANGIASAAVTSQNGSASPSSSSKLVFDRRAFSCTTMMISQQPTCFFSIPHHLRAQALIIGPRWMWF